MATSPPVPAAQPSTHASQLREEVLAQAQAAAVGNMSDDQAIRENLSSGAIPIAPAGTRISTSTDKLATNPTLQPTEAHSPLQNTFSSSIENDPPAVYSETYGQVDFSQDGFNTQARVANDGRVNIHINQKSRRLSELLVPALRSQLNLQQEHEASPTHSPYIPPSLGGQPVQLPPPPLNVTIHVVGSRGDVQPFVALGIVLKEKYGHRVRLATHPTFRSFVEENGLEFFSIGGDPAELMAFMVKNPGLMPGIDSLRAGDVGKRRKDMYEIVQGCWRSCIEIGDGTGIRVSDDNMGSRSSIDSGIVMDGDSSVRPFVADAIIANPPSFAHIHCAEKLGIPLHLMFTMPYSPTQAFPHPLANIQSSNADASITNFVSYALVEMMTWQGLGDVINRFREDSLGLEPVSLMWAPGMASRLRIPYTYCWSPTLIPKPKDWGPHISISGFYFLSLASNFTPDPELANFLRSGPAPIYIGFGSIVVDDPNAMTKLIFEAVKKTGQRALVSKGWGGFGADAMGIPDGVFMLGNVPHDWLFKHVSCVVHHGGAGTTAAGIAMGKPTVVVPFFGDQPFWGAMVAKAGAGPTPVPSKNLTADNLAAAILAALEPAALEKAQRLGASISSEVGTEVGAQSFHDKLDMDSLRCTLVPTRAAAWRIKRTNIRLSPFAAATLGHEGLLDFGDLKLYRPREYDSEDGPWDPISGGASALLGTLGSLAMGFADFPVEILKALRIKSTEDKKIGDITQQVQTASTEVSKVATASSSLPNVSNAGKPDHLKRTESPSPTKEGISTSENVTLNKIDTPQSPKSHSLKGNGHSSSSNSLQGFFHRNSTSHAQGPSVHRSQSQSSSNTEPGSQHLHRSFTANQASQISIEAALGAGKGIGRIVGAGLKSPMDFTLSLARGFHNAPKLYGDESVREADKITGIHSGLKAAGKEFGLGFYDGITGLLTQPFEGAKKEGVAGLIKGFGKGLGGVVLKPGAAIWGLPGYTFKGIYKEIQKLYGSSVQNYIVASRTAQGYEDWGKSSHEERLNVVSRWHEVQLQLDKEKQQARHNSFYTPQGFLKSRHLSCDDRKRNHHSKKLQKRNQRAKEPSRTNSDSAVIDAPLHHARTYPVISIGRSDSAAFEEAIQTSVAATSRGDLKQDQLIERAIRASVLELQSASQEGDNNEAIQRAIQASITEATRARAEHAESESAPTHSDSDHHSEQLQAAIHRSISMHDKVGSNEEQRQSSRGDFDDSGVDTEDDENIKFAVDQSKLAIRAKPASLEDLDLQRAIQESKLSHEEHERGVAKARIDKEKVLEHVKRQSWIEGNGSG